ncbi:MAG: UvrD-helicase domain-containing protein [Patescibacteria group bacterium]|nr:UvrD-helicase domain-containing protein [Patescibacteria group bacterium]
MDHLLNPQQEKAAHAPQKPLLIVAGAGTGKTKTLTSRFIHLVAQGIHPSHICALTFTNKAAKEMGGRVHRAVTGGISVRDAFIGTFHSFGARILRAEAATLERTPHFTIFDDHDSLGAIKKVLKELDIKNGTPSQFLRFISFEKSGVAQGMRTGTYEDRAVFKNYELFLTRANAFDFDDLIVKMVWLFRNNPSVLEKYQNKYTHILVDEYQDVSPMQYALIQCLAARHRNISVVGDDAQMIYGWRYASLDTFLNFEKDWPNAQVILLEENYRSTGTIIHASSAVIANNQRAREKSLWTNNMDGSLILIAETASEDDEAEWIADHIDSKSNNPETMGNSCAILYRTNAQSRALEQALVRRGIPYRIYGGLKFYERREIKNIIAALRLALNPRDEISYDRLQKTFRIRAFRTMLPSILALADTTPAEAIKSFLDVTHYFEYLERETINADERQENIRELLQFATQFSTLSEFLEHVALVQATDNASSDTSRTTEQGKDTPPPVHLSTVHLAKGLEFDEVFLAGCTEGMLPHMRSMDSQDEIEEERRLMYVAMTRARRELAISFYGLPSRFIGEIPNDLIMFFRTSNTDKFSDAEERNIQLEDI